MRFFTSVHLLLLAYIIAALVYWEIALQKQSAQIYAGDITILKSQVDSLHDPGIYNQRFSSLRHKRIMRTYQFGGEGTAFLIVILIGAVVVYTSFVRRITLSRQQNNFMLSVTHELKSPIAAMKLNLQTIEKHRQLDEGKRIELVERSIKEANRLNDLCNNMLLISRIEGRQYKPAKELFDLSEMIKDTLNDYASRHTRKFEKDVTPGCKITGDKMMLQIALNNLLENAVKYTPADKPVHITLHKKQNAAIIRVADQGSGIPDNEKKKVFNKFYRVGNEESRRTTGTGLGLYITKKIIRQHKGRITVKDNTPSGSVFEIILTM